MDKLIITAALTGAEVTLEQQPALPVTPGQIALAAAECAAAGAAIVHVHGRRPDGSSTQDPAVYGAIMHEVAACSNVIVQISTGGEVGMSAEERIAPVALKPEMATLSMGSVNFGDDVFLNPPAEMRHFLQVMRQHEVVPEFEIFDSGMLHTLLHWIKKGVVSTPCHVDFVLGVPGGMAASLESLMFLRSQLPADVSWTVAGVGAAQLPLACHAILLGGHVRVGFEDNIYYSRGVLADSNAQLVARISRLAAELGRPVASPDEARTMLGIRRE